MNDKDNCFPFGDTSIILSLLLIEYQER